MKQIQVIPAERIDIYAGCPKQFEYYRDRPLPSIHSPKSRLLKSIVSNAYLKALRETRLNPWRQVTTEIDKFVFTNLLPNDAPGYEEDLDIKYKQSIKLIRAVQKNWYDTHFLKEDLQGFPKLSCAYECTDNILVTDTADLVLFNEKDLILCTFSNIELKPAMLYNDIRLRIQALMLNKNLGRTITKIRGIYWTDDDTIGIRDINIHNPIEFMRKTETAMLHMIDGIRRKAFYPSVNEQCNSCPFNNICSF